MYLYMMRRVLGEGVSGKDEFSHYLVFEGNLQDSSN